MSRTGQNVAAVGRDLPVAIAESDRAPMRATQYGDQIMQAVGGWRHALADEGSYFVATNPTIGTAVAMNAVVTAFSDTTGFFVIYNSSNENEGGQRVYLDYLKLKLVSAGTSTTVTDIAVVLDNIPREPTTAANRTLLTPVNVNGCFSNGAWAVPMCYSVSAAMTIPASSGASRIVSRASIPWRHVSRDTCTIQFGGMKQVQTGGLTGAKATAISSATANCPPVVIGPQQWVVIHLWNPGAGGGPTYEFELTWWER